MLREDGALLNDLCFSHSCWRKVLPDAESPRALLSSLVQKNTCARKTKMIMSPWCLMHSHCLPSLEAQAVLSIRCTGLPIHTQTNLAAQPPPVALLADSVSVLLRPALGPFHMSLLPRMAPFPVASPLSLNPQSSAVHTAPRSPWILP